MRTLIALFCLLSLPALAANTINMAYVEVNDHALKNAGCYLSSTTGKPFIDMVSIFAANINGNDPNHPYVYLNPQVKKLLNQTDEVKELQDKGIKVLITFLGNHQQAGWSCMSDELAIAQFAHRLVQVVNQYHLDGIDIDDEYARCKSNDTSLLRLARAIKQDPDFKGKLLTKALFNDYHLFKASDHGQKLADFLDEGWEMTYYSSSYEYRLKPYLNAGMSKHNLILGITTDQSTQAQDAMRFVMQHQYAGMMIYNLKNNSQFFLSQLANAKDRSEITITPGCLTFA